MELVAQGALGLAAFIAIAWAVSENRRAFPWRLVLIGLVLQFAIALLLLKVPALREALAGLTGVVDALDQATGAGARFVFGYLGGGEGAPFPVDNPDGLFILAFRALPIILVTSALSALLYHWRVLPLVVRGMAWALRRTMGVGGAVGVSTAANIFVGMVEAPLLIRPYVKALTRSELFMVMTAGMATVAGTVIVLYALILGSVIENALGQIIAASLISAPAALLLAAVMVPPDREAATAGDIVAPEPYDGAIDAITKGTLSGVALLINVIALLLVFVALVSLVDIILGLFGAVGDAPLSLTRIFGWLLAPLAWLTGVPWAEAQTAGGLLATKIVLNEFLAYLQLAGLEEGALSDRSQVIMLYALCGFANFGSLGIMIGGLVAIAPERRAEIVALGMRSILSGLLATCMTGAVAGILWTA